MKKALIAIISVIYIVAIVIVAFLGGRAEGVKGKVFVESIELHTTTCYKDNTTVPYLVVIPRPREIEIGDDGKDMNNVTWNVIEDGEIKKKIGYYLDFKDITYIQNEMHNEFQLDVRVKPDDATKKDLTYYFGDDTYLTVTNTGLITFVNDPVTTFVGDMTISSTDLSGVKLNVRLVLR